MGEIDVDSMNTILEDDEPIGYIVRKPITEYTPDGFPRVYWTVILNEDDRVNLGTAKGPRASDELINNIAALIKTYRESGVIQA